MTGVVMTGNRQSLRYYKNDRDYDRGFVWVSTENLSWKEHYYNYLQLFCTKHGIKRLTETPLPRPHRHSITFGREKRQPEIRLLSQTRKEVPNFDFQLIADILKKGNKFRLSIVGRHIEKRYAISTFAC